MTNTMQLKAIQTQYRGYNFRSRLEARWAVFFDALGIKWEYEVEGFDLGEAGYYLPDFRVASPQGQLTWYEVKPEGAATSAKFEAFAALQSAAYASRGCEDHEGVALLVGDPMSYFRTESVAGLWRAYNKDASSPRTSPLACPRCGQLDAGVNIALEDSIFVECLPCDFKTPGGDGHPLEPGLLSPVQPHKGLMRVYNSDLTDCCHKIYRACVAARSARFEHGHSGATT